MQPVPSQFQHLPSEVIFKPVPPFQLTFLNLNVVAKVRQKVKDPMTGKNKKVKMNKTILNNASGIFSPNTFTAIIGPSGCGKTTLLNIVSGRLMSGNLKLSGNLFVNKRDTKDMNIYGERIGYVMQQDILLATFTPRECFMFVANMRLSDLSRAEREAKVQETIQALGLKKCANTYIGNELIRGVSGGEKKRTSIGVELLINPSILYLDQPTTGLDSTTALNVINFLNKLAKNGRTVISTIHQPSSEIFAVFDRLIIMVQGHVVYQGDSKFSRIYFQRIGFPVPRNSNPTDYYMKTMNKEGLQMSYLARGVRVPQQRIKVEFSQLIQFFKDRYRQNPPVINPVLEQPMIRSGGKGYLPFVGQVFYITKRSLTSQFRNPMDLAIRTLQIVFQAIVGIILFYKKGEQTFNIIQNVQGAIFYMLSCIIFAGIFANLAAFNLQRAVFLRERMSNTYSTFVFFVGRTIAAMPLDLFMPFLFLIIFYFPVHLVNTAPAFFWALLISEEVYFMSASYGLLLSATLKDMELVMALVPIVIIPLMLVGGFFSSLNNVPKIFYPLEYISMFKYGFQTYIQNNYRYNNPTDCMDGTKCDILQTKYKFKEPFWLSMILMVIIGVVMRLLALLALHFLNNPKRMKLKQGNVQLPHSQQMAQPQTMLQPQLMSNIRLMNGAAPGQIYPVAYGGYPAQPMIAQAPYPAVQYAQSPIPTTQYAASPVPLTAQQVYYA